VATVPHPGDLFELSKYALIFRHSYLPWYASHIHARQWSCGSHGSIIACLGFTVFGKVISFQKVQLVDLTNDGQPDVVRGSHSFATTAQLHHFPSTRLRPSRSCRVWLDDYGNPCQNPNVYSWFAILHLTRSPNSERHIRYFTQDQKIGSDLPISFFNSQNVILH
jgi:hypothetical protein